MRLMDRRPLAVLIIAMLLAPALALMLTMRGEIVAADPDISDNYDFKDNENNAAWYYTPAGTDYTMDLNPNQVSGTATVAVQTADYVALENSDDSRWGTSGGAGNEEEQYFRFLIGEDVSTIDNIVVSWEGWGQTEDGTVAYAYIWDISTMSWKEIAHNTTASDVTYTFENHDNIEAYIDENNHLWVAASSITVAGSCPVLYVWNGGNYETIGTVSIDSGFGYPSKIENDGLDFETPNPIDYAIIDDGQLKADDGAYKLVLAEDLSEITYQDSAQLYKVFHPIGTQLISGTPIYVAPPFLQDTFHTIKNPVSPVEAYMEDGTDILPLIAKIDDKYTNESKPFYDRPFRFTLDFGDLSDAEQIKLVFTGATEWVYVPPFEPSYAEVIDENGNWTRVDSRIDSLPELTIEPQIRTFAIDVTDWFLTDNYSIRFTDWHVKRWNYIAVDTSLDEWYLMTELEMTGAQLFRKGVSRMINNPEGFTWDYDDVRFIEDKFEGNFTRYGDVYDVLVDSDDKFVIMAPNDAIEVKYDRGHGIADLFADLGFFKRSFILVSDAYHKEEFVKYWFDEDICKVEPLPFHDMSCYPYPENESYPWNDEHLEWWDEYQTRYIEPGPDTHNTLYTDYVQVVIHYTPAVVPVLPTQPTLISPENDNTIIYDNTPTFYWVGGDNADNHTLRVDNDSDFSSPEVEENGLSVETFTIADENALADEIYWWSVTAINENGENASDNYTFTLMTSAPFTFGWEENGENSKNVSYGTGLIPVSVHSVSGQEAGYENTKAIDNDLTTYWWHEVEEPWIVFDLGESRTVTQFEIYLNTKVGTWGTEGMLVYVSENTTDWGDNVWEGELKGTPKGWKGTAGFSKLGRYIKLVSQSLGTDEKMIDVRFYTEWPPSRRMLGSVFRLTHLDGIADNIMAYFGVGIAFPENFRAAIYLDNGQLIGETEQMTGYFQDSANPAWYTLDFPDDNRPALSRNTEYVLVLWGDGDIYFCYDNVAGSADQGHYAAEEYVDNFPDNVTFTHDGTKKYSIYASVSYSGGYPEDPNPAQSQPHSGEIVVDNTPSLEAQKGSPWENTNMFRVLVDNDSNMLSPWIDVLVEPNWEIPYEFRYDVLDNEALAPGTWYWKPIPKNPLYEKTNVPTEYFIIPGDAYIITQDATSITSTQATLNAAITYTDVASVNTHFQYKWKPENWVLENYVMPTDPATSEDWANRATVNYVAASDSEGYGFANYVCDGTADHVEIQAALDNVAGEGVVYLFDGTYNTQGTMTIGDNTSLIGENKDNTFLQQIGTSIYLLWVRGDNVLIENLSLHGDVNYWKGSTETQGIAVMNTIIENLVIRNNYLQYFSFSGIDLERAYSRKIWIINNEIRDTGGPGISTGVPAGAQHVGPIIREFYIDNNTVIRGGVGSGYYGSGGSGIEIGGSRHGIIVNNHIIDSGYDGILIREFSTFDATENILIESNLIENSGYIVNNQAGITLRGTSSYITHNITIRRNRFFDNKENYTGYGVYFASYVENSVVDNNDFFYVENAWVELGAGHVIENNVGATYDNTILENTALESYSKVLTGLEPERTYAFRGRIWFDGSSDDGIFRYFSTTAVQWNLIDNWTGTIIAPTAIPVVENLYITDMDNVAADNLAPETQYKFWVEISDNETLADIENVTLIVYLDNENLPDNAVDHYTFRWTRDGGFEEVGPGGLVEVYSLVDDNLDYWHDARLPSQHSAFYVSGRFWVFYDTDIKWRTSMDGQTWSAPQTVGKTVSVAAYFSVWLDDEDNFNLFASGYYYRKGTPQENGDITWLAGWQNTGVFEAYNDPHISTDSEGYPWISGWGVDNLGIKKSSKKDGTWSTASGFPYYFDNVNGKYSVIPIPLDDNKMYVVYAPTSLFAGDENLLKGRLWNNGDWGNVENISTSKVSTAYYQMFSAASIENDVYVVFLSENENIVLIKRTWGSGWGSEEVVQDNVNTKSTPTMVLDKSANDIYVFWAKTDHHIYYKKRTSDGSWSEITDWIDESADTLYPYSCVVCSAYETYDNKIVIYYVTKSSSPFKLKFAYMDLRNYDHLTPDNCILFDNTKTTDNIVFAIEFGENATVTANDNWDVWVQVYDSYGNEDNRFFLNQFDIISPFAWELIETWTGSVEAPVAWIEIENWSGTVEAPAGWQLIETWTGSLETPVGWELIETWSGTIEAVSQWNLLETWTGTIQAPSVWQLIETWSGTVEAPVAWLLLETWSGVVEAPVGWNLIEEWTGALQTPAVWQLIETWSGTVESPSAWSLIETWSGTVEAPAQWELIESWSGTVQAPTAWILIESWDGTVQAPAAWELIETWDGTVEAPTAWELIETWTGTVEAFSGWQLIETWSGTVQAPTAWLLVESWSGTVEAPSEWQQIESWTGTIEAPSEWSLIESWTGTVIAPVAWELIETWGGTIEAFSGWQLMEEWSGTVEAFVGWQLIESWSGTIAAPAEWMLIETWTGAVEAPVGWQLIESWSGTIEAFSGWSLLETWTGAIESFVGWQLIETWDGTLEAFAEWSLIESWSGTVQAPTAWMLIETWTGDIEAPTAWQLIETWAGTVDAPTAWLLVESWSGTVMAYVEWQQVESWTGTIQAPIEWSLIETWTGTVESPTAWQLISTWGGTIQSPSVWDLIESWSGSIQAPSEWSEIENWSGGVIAVGWTLIETWSGTVETHGWLLVETWTGGIRTPTFYAVVIVIIPITQSGTMGETLEYTVTITNEGGQADNYALTADDPKNWGIYLENEQLEVPTGENRTTTLSVPLETIDTHDITVNVVSETDNTVSDDENIEAISRSKYVPPPGGTIGGEFVALGVAVIAIGLAIALAFLFSQKRREDE